ncbi:MAG: zinc ribbon domain-containing protein [Methanomassiliicoccales archaeon]|nr:MAG: zinc ribbon domain-containing protein [Methanomassiliicoccales archaeon]
MNLNAAFEDLKKKKWVWVIYISMAIPINLLFALSGNCLALIFIAIVTLVIPYFFGVRGIKTFLKAGIVIILITGILYGAIYTYFMYNEMFYPYFTDRTVGDTQLEDGTVTPYLGNETTFFNYTVRYTGEESPDNITVYANVTDAAGEVITSFPLKNTDGMYYNETRLERDIYYFYFAAHLNSTDEWLKTGTGFGPVTVPYEEMMTLQIFFGALSLLLNSGIFFFMFVAFLYFRKKSQEDKMKLEEKLKAEEETKVKEKKDEKKEEKEKKKEDEKDEFTCTSCNAVVSADANFCPKCGEEFEGIEDEEEEKEGEKKEEKEVKEEEKEEVKEEFTCTECGATVDAQATSCPSCGEDFED